MTNIFFLFFFVNQVRMSTTKPKFEDIYRILHFYMFKCAFKKRKEK